MNEFNRENLTIRPITDSLGRHVKAFEYRANGQRICGALPSGLSDDEVAEKARVTIESYFAGKVGK